MSTFIIQDLIKITLDELQNSLHNSSSPGWTISRKQFCLRVDMHSIRSELGFQRKCKLTAVDIHFRTWRQTSVRFARLSNSKGYPGVQKTIYIILTTLLIICNMSYRGSIHLIERKCQKYNFST